MNVRGAGLFELQQKLKKVKNLSKIRAAENGHSAKLVAQANLELNTTVEAITGTLSMRPCKQKLLP